MAFSSLLNVCVKLVISESSAFSWVESQAGGAGGRNWLPDEIAQVFHNPARGSAGFVPVQRQGPVGTVPVHTMSDPSALAHVITLAAASRPSLSPAITSLGYWTPANKRELAACCAILAYVCASAGNRYPRIAAAAPAAAACSDG